MNPGSGSVLSNPRIVAAFATLYLVWGSTYLAIRIVVERLPPFYSAGIRFTIAGALMLGWAWLSGHRLPTSRRDWLTLSVTGIMMLVGANGMVTWAEQWVESNQAALIVATSALWLAWLGTLGAQGQGLARWTVVGLLSGFLGVAVLVGDGLRFAHAPWTAYAALLISAFFWSLGSILSKRRPVACGALMSAAVQTLVAAVVLTIGGLALGEADEWVWEARPLLALAYLVVVGSCIGYGCFLWLVHQVTPAQLGTYAYVNPAVAVLLGWWLLDEQLTGMQIVGTLIILASVILVTLTSAVRRPVPA
ncbi:MAG: EamA family transporter [Panacagrimonas sp.]